MKLLNACLCSFSLKQALQGLSAFHMTHIQHNEIGSKCIKIAVFTLPSATTFTSVRKHDGGVG
jgi:hypothetical protein